jgi:iron(III) transport system ATP-binding protein
MTELALRGVSKRYGPVLALDGVDLVVDDGERVAIVGPSGSGKTTLLRVTAGFEIPDAGTVSLDGAPVADAGRIVVPAHRRGIGLMAQDGALFPHLDVAGNVGYALPRHADRDRRVSALLEGVGLDPAIRTRRVDQLSGGQQQRVALARAMAVAPRVLLLDEPFSALDAASRLRTRDAVVRVLAAARSTALLVTHDEDDADAFATRIIRMEGGRVIASEAAPSSTHHATPLELLAPASCPTCGRPFSTGHGAGAGHGSLTPARIDAHPERV